MSWPSPENATPLTLIDLCASHSLLLWSVLEAWEYIVFCG